MKLNEVKEVLEDEKDDKKSQTDWKIGNVTKREESPVRVQMTEEMIDKDVEAREVNSRA